MSMPSSSVEEAFVMVNLCQMAGCIMQQVFTSAQHKTLPIIGDTTWNMCAAITVCSENRTKASSESLKLSALNPQP